MAMRRDEPELERRLCGVCGSSERWFLHYIHHKGAFQRLCTNCVLQNYRGLYCPLCLDYFDQPLPARDRVMCVKCPSVSHPACVLVANSSFHGFECHSCPQGYLFFTLNRPQNDANDAKTACLIDKANAKALVAAAKIAAASMAKAAVLARTDSERRVREAVLAKKKAREALEKLSSLVNKQKQQDSKAGDVVSGPESLNGKPKLESSDGIPAAPKIVKAEGSNGLVGDRLKMGNVDAMEE
ncbi:uncharacterized protein LOC103959086 [Pyrus x bretschneideri]|uniref:uncharacterized protein LOC103959086 n=1 Tax=Pyrus x bretschneideri TaxID=225117 RepID=UPI000510E7AE|nr:uncharacterized protein LOC103959086 [Pyrus x bretschneideri]